jgi:hypothetical protein
MRPGLDEVGTVTGMESRNRSRGSALPYVALLCFAAVPPVVFELISVFGDHNAPDGRCEGIGFGCTTSQAAGAKFLLILVLPLMILWAIAGSAALTLLRRRVRYRARPAIVQGLLPVAPAFFLLLFLLVI